MDCRTAGSFRLLRAEAQDRLEPRGSIFKRVGSNGHPSSLSPLPLQPQVVTGASTKGSRVTFPALRPDLYWVARRNGWEQLLPSALAGINSYGWFDHPGRIAILPALFIESRPSRRRVSSRPHDLTRWPGLTLRLGHTHAHVQSRGWPASHACNSNL